MPAVLNSDAFIYVAGHKGMVGSAIVRHLCANGYHHLITKTHGELDLTDQQAVRRFFSKESVDYVVLAAAKVGGIQANNTQPADFIYQNLLIETHVIHEAFAAGIQRLLFLGSSCIYPKICPQPMKEEYLLTGRLEPTNAPYAIAKIAGIQLCEAYNRQYDTKYRSVMPTNLYGPNDNYDLKMSHVIPALIRKFHLAKLARQGNKEAICKDEACFGPIPDSIKSNLVAIAQSNGHTLEDPFSPAERDLTSPEGITLWGTGAPYREFLHVDDLASACVFVMGLSDADYQNHTDSAHPHINIGSGRDITIKELAEIIREIVGFEGEIAWDASKPDGTPKKRLDISRLLSLGWKQKISLKEGISRTYQTYLAETNKH